MQIQNPEPSRSFQTGTQFYSINEQSDSEEGFPQLPLLSYQEIFRQICAGYLPKKTQNVTWQERYFCLTPFRLIYYLDNSKKQMKGCFNFGSLLEYSLHLNSEYPSITFVIKVPESGHQKNHEILKLLIENREHFSIWRNHFSSIIHNLYLTTQHRGPACFQYFPKITPESIRGQQSHRYWNEIKLSIKQFQHYANHLDLIFFRSNHDFSNLQRFFMGSYFDHIGIIFRDQKNSIYILEAVYSRGVCATSWKQLSVELRQNYSSVGYRKIICANKDVWNKFFELELEKQLNKVIGKRYELNLTKIFGNDSLDQQEEATYFCSELVADIYLKLGVLKNKSKNQYWPKDFEQKLQLEHGMSLSPLFQIQI